jgi:nucleoside-diphosphate-sugar epimerase
MHSLEGQVIAVTGATGFLGSHIARALLAAGARVIGVVRSPEKGRWLAEQGVVFRKADLGDEASLATAFDGCNVVVANAALATKKRASLTSFREANVGGVERTMGAVATADVKRVVHISSVGVYQVRMGRVMDESTPVRERFRVDPSLLTTNWRYTLTKAQGERVARVLAEASGVDLTVFRPGPVYGSRDTKFLPKLVRRAQRSWAIVPSVGVPMVHAGDVADAVVAALSNPVSRGRTYNLGGTTHPLPEVIRAVAEVLETKCRVVAVPLGMGVQFDDGAVKRDLGIQHRPLLDGLREALYTPL